jgi:phenylpropionate dioxygenase-like ring-hydroxylating dioxygenase large terminal subunit
MVMTIARDGGLIESGWGQVVPKERYVSREFFDLEMDRLWPRVWQIACREEEVPGVGDFLEYVIGDQSVLVTRSEPDVIKAFYNTCPHRGTRLATGVGNFSTGEIRCRFHAWRFELDGTNKQVVDRFDFPSDMTDAEVCLNQVKVGRWGGFVFVNMDPAAEPLAAFLDPLPGLLDPYRFEKMRYRSYRSVVLPANWKCVLDAFNESYHVQGTHPQLLRWSDDTAIKYGPLGKHNHMGSLGELKREIRPSPRLGLGPDDYDERELLAMMIDELGGLFLKEERQQVEELRDKPLPEGKTAMEAYNDLRVRMLRSKGNVEDLTDEQLQSSDDVHIFPNVVGPIYPGSTTLFRVRPNGLDPDTTIKDLWTLEWVSPEDDREMCERKFYPDWTAKDWGQVTNQDYANMAHVQAGMKSRGCTGLRLNPRQEHNVFHMHEVIDQYLCS